MDEVKLLLGDVSTPESAVEFDPEPKTVSPIQWIWANQAAHNAQEVTEDDLREIGYQTDTNIYYQLTSVTPVVWQQVPNPAGTSTSSTPRATPNTIRDLINPLWTWTNIEARNAQQVSQDDLGKIGYQKDNNTYWQLTAATPIAVWQNVPNPTDTSSPFELSTGASDAPSYHDFFRLQIAFEDVWAELRGDTQIANAGIQLYAKFDALMDKSADAYDHTGKKDRESSFPKPPKDGFSGADELKHFLKEVKLFLGLPSDLPGASQNAQTDFNELKRWVIQALHGCNMLRSELNRVGSHPPGADLTKPAWDWSKWFAATPGNPDADEPTPPGDTMSAYPPGTKRENAFDYVIANLNSITAPSSSGLDPQLKELIDLLEKLDAMLKEHYRFDVFAPASINYGLLLNYRQHWVPQSYQVGNLVTTIPLAPQETRRYTTKTVVKKTRSVKEIEDSLRSGKDEASNTWRVDAEIVDRAKNQTNFQTNAKGSYGAGEIYKVEGGMQVGKDQGVESAQTKREFHESVVKAAQEYRNEHRTEVTTEESREDESTSFREIRNPNDELTVTYLFYELQRRYLVSEELYKVRPVVLVANEVPAPHEVDPAWILRYDWIIKRAILDDSFLPALEYLAANYTGEEVTLQTLELAVAHQKSVVDKISQQVLVANQSLDTASMLLQTSENQAVQDQHDAEIQKQIKAFFDPLGIGQAGTPSDGNFDRARVEFARDTLNRAQAKVNQLVSDLKTETTALQVAIDKYTAAATKHFGMLAEIDRLRIHVKDNIIHYMQAIWTYEPSDQRYFRLYDLDVPMFEHNTTLPVNSDPRPVPGLDQKNPSYRIPFPPPQLSSEPSKLHQIADLDSLLGFKGNYMIFPLVNFHNYMAWYLVHPYISFDNGGVTVADPDPDAGLTVPQLQALMSSIYANQKNRAWFSENEAAFEETMFRLLSKQNPEMVIVPSNSLYIEALPGTHPLLEDFKLMHRAIDVKKAQAELRKAELENLRLAARLANGELADPDIDKVVVVGRDQHVTVDVGQ